MGRAGGGSPSCALGPSHLPARVPYIRIQRTAWRASCNSDEISPFVSVTTRCHLNVVIVAAVLLQATGGRVEQMEEQKRQMSGMQMFCSSTGANFSSSTQLHKVSQGLSRTLKGGNHRLPTTSAMLSSGAIQLWHKA